jgi:hypothetical protein
VDFMEKLPEGLSFVEEKAPAPKVQKKFKEDE